MVKDKLKWGGYRVDPADDETDSRMMYMWLEAIRRLSKYGREYIKVLEGGSKRDKDLASIMRAVDMYPYVGIVEAYNELVIFEQYAHGRKTFREDLVNFRVVTCLRSLVYRIIRKRMPDALVEEAVLVASEFEFKIDSFEAFAKLMIQHGDDELREEYWFIYQCMEKVRAGIRKEELTAEERLVILIMDTMDQKSALLFTEEQLMGSDFLRVNHVLSEELVPLMIKSMDLMEIGRFNALEFEEEVARINGIYHWEQIENPGVNLRWTDMFPLSQILTSPTPANYIESIYRQFREGILDDPKLPESPDGVCDDMGKKK